MKRMVQFTVLVVALLLLAGVSFAQNWCDCYKMSWIDLDSPECYDTSPTLLCFSLENQTGSFKGFCNDEGEMTLF